MFSPFLLNCFYLSLFLLTSFSANNYFYFSENVQINKKATPKFNFIDDQMRITLITNTVKGKYIYEKFSNIVTCMLYSIWNQIQRMFAENKKHFICRCPMYSIYINNIFDFMVCGKAYLRSAAYTTLCNRPIK